VPGFIYCESKHPDQFPPAEFVLVACDVHDLPVMVNKENVNWQDEHVMSDIFAMLLSMLLWRWRWWWLWWW